MADSFLFQVGDLEFEWDAEKARANHRKHGIEFFEGATVFQDRLALILPDPDAFADELRFQLLGYSRNLRLVIVVHLERDERIRIVSVRKANKIERSIYEERQG